MVEQIDSILDEQFELEKDEQGEHRQEGLLEDHQVFQSMGLVGLFRRKPFNNPCVSACQLCLFVYHEQANGRVCTYLDIKDCLGIKEEELIAILNQLGLCVEKTWGGYLTKAIDPSEGVFEPEKFAGKKIEDWSFSLIESSFKKISDIKSYSVYKKN